MPSQLHDDFEILLGTQAQLVIPGVAPGKWLDLATMALGGHLFFAFDAGEGPITFTSMDEVPGETDTTKTSLTFTLAGISGTFKVVLLKAICASPTIGGTPVACNTNVVDFSALTALFGTFTMRFWNGFDVTRVRGWHFAS